MTLYKCFIALLIVALLGLQYRLWFGHGSFTQISNLEKEVALRRAEKLNKEERNAILKAEIKDLKEGFDAAEEVARSELGLIKEGETFFLLVEE